MLRIAGVSYLLLLKNRQKSILQSRRKRWQKHLLSSLLFMGQVLKPEYASVFAALHKILG